MGPDGAYGGDIRVGDVDNDQIPDFVVYRCATPSTEGDALKPCFIAAFNLEGDVLWKIGSGGTQPARPGPVILYDINGDGNDELICLFFDGESDPDSTRLVGLELQIRDGATGELVKSTAPEALLAPSGSGANWVHQRLIVAQLSPGPRAKDFVIKLGDTLFAIDQELKIKWSYTSPWTEYQKCPAYIPTVGDIDGDGLDEVNGGYFLLDHDGSVLWETFLGPNMDSVAIAPWDEGRMRAICSGSGQILDAEGKHILNLGPEVVPHGQELRLGVFDPDLPAPQMMIRYNGHKPETMLVDNEGRIARRFRLNDSPNHTGMETVYPEGPNGTALLFNGGELWTGKGRSLGRLPELPPEIGNFRQGWYHCIPANIKGDAGDELIVYNPWDRFIFVYGNQTALSDSSWSFYPDPRQYNARLLD